MTRRVCLALDLVDDAALIEAYEQAHAPGAVWPEIVAGIHAAGWVDMEIWRAGDRLVMVGEVAEDWPRPLSPGQIAASDRWEAEMDRFQRRLSLAASGEKWTPMQRIFALGDQQVP